MLLIPLGLDQSRGDQIDNAKNFESKGYGRHIPEDQLTEVNLLQELNDIELHRESIIKTNGNISRELHERRFI